MDPILQGDCKVKVDLVSSKMTLCQEKAMHDSSSHSKKELPTPKKNIPLASGQMILDPISVLHGQMILQWIYYQVCKGKLKNVAMTKCIYNENNFKN